MTSSEEEFIPTRYSLLSRLQDWDDQDSWRVFFDTYWRLVYSVAIRAGLTESEAQDVVQETIICVAKDIHKFKRDPSAGSFKGWLKNLTRWRIADQLRKRGSHHRDQTINDEMEMDSFADPNGGELEREWDGEWRANLIVAATERVKRQVREEHFQIFDLNVLRHWPARQVATTLGINIGRVYLAKHRVSALVRKEIKALERELY